MTSFDYSSGINLSLSDGWQIDFNPDGQIAPLTNNAIFGANVANLSTSAGNWELKYSEDFNSDVSWPEWNRYGGVPGTPNVDSWNNLNNVTVADGLLQLAIKPEENGSMSYSAGGIDTGFGYKQEYGKWSVRAKAPAGQGVGGYVGIYAEDEQGNPIWPPEITLMEVQGKDPTRNVMAVWTQDLQQDYTAYVGADFTADFHTYSVEYEPGLIRWYVDDVLHKTAFIHLPPNLKWKIAIGDGVGTADNSLIGAPDHTTIFPTSMQVDWVRIYQKA